MLALLEYLEVLLQFLSTFKYVPFTDLPIEAVNHFIGQILLKLAFNVNMVKIEFHFFVIPKMKMSKQKDVRIN
jgi:hypothetical protein